VLLGKWLPDLRNVAVFLASGQSNVGLLDPEGEGSTILLSVNIYPTKQRGISEDLNLQLHRSEHLRSLENARAIVNRITVTIRPFTDIYCLPLRDVFAVR